jgi:hypothetical protein
MRGLQDQQLMASKKKEEEALRAALNRDAKMARAYGNLWREVADSYKEFTAFYKQYWLFERGAVRGSQLMEIARDVIRYSEEKNKPNEQRLKEFRETALPSLEQGMFSAAPVDIGMERAVIASYLGFLEQQLGKDDPTVRALLAGKSPAKAAEEYVGATKLRDIAERKRLAANPDAVRASNDGMIRLLRTLEGPARQYRKLYEDKVESVERSSAARIAQARFAVLGATSYPDATFTLRLSYGPVRGYESASGKMTPYATRIDGLYARATGQDPFKLPESWLKSKSKLNLTTPFDFVSTNDTHGGNSGSPTVNTKGEIVGILFDGNLEGLPNRFVYTDKDARSVHVASQVIIEALRVVYGAKSILAELGM